MNGHVNGSAGFPAALQVKVINSFAAHTNDVISVAWTGNILASGSADKMIHVWKMTKKIDGHVELIEMDYSPMIDHIYHVQCLHFSSFGQQLATCASDGKIVLWDTATGRQLASDNYPSQTLTALRCCRISPDSRLIAAAGDSDSVALWSWEKAQGMRLLKVFYGHEGTVTCVCFTHDSALLLSGSIGSDIRIWDCRSLKDQAIRIWKDAHDLGCTCMDLAPYKINTNHGDPAFHIASGGYDNTIKLWHLIDRSDAPVKFSAGGGTLRGHSADICSVRFANQTKLLISCSSDRTLIIWDPIKCAALKRVGPLTKYVRSCCFSSDDLFFMAGFSGGIIGFWRIAAEGQDCSEQSITVARTAADRALQMDFLESTAPDEFVCPITQEIMRDPVVALDGISYERTAIENWFKNHATSPQTNLVLSSRSVVPNINLKLLIYKWIQLNKKTSDA